MPRKFFLRNDPKTVQNAKNLTLEEFAKEYSETTATQEVLERAYNEIRLKHHSLNAQAAPPVPKEYVQGKSVTFKVIKDEKVKDTVIEPVKSGMINTFPPARKVNVCKEVKELLTNKNIETDNELFTEVLKQYPPEAKEENKPQLQPLPATKTTKSTVTTGKRNVGRQPLANADKRDARILELLREKKKGSEIITIMKGEGFSVHAPQITLLKQSINSLLPQ